MEEALRFFRTYEIWIYLLLGLGGLIYLRKFFLSWQDLRGAAFGLERDSAQVRVNQSASILVLLVTMVLIEFVLVSYIAPAVPGATPLLTPTLDLLASPTVTLQPVAVATSGDATAVVEALTATAAAGNPLEGGSVPATPQPGEPGVGNPAGTPGVQAGPGCIPDQIFIAFPPDGEEISDSVEISGTVRIPDFGFYKLEMKLQDDVNWLTILAGNEVKQEAPLGTWNTSLLPPGNYQLGLVVTDNQGKSMPPCVVNVRVAPPVETPQP